MLKKKLIDDWVWFSAMQKKPEGESRTPTDLWAGLGFSKSMPAAEMREKLQRNNVRYGDSALGRQYQVCFDFLFNSYNIGIHWVLLYLTLTSLYMI